MAIDQIPANEHSIPLARAIEMTQRYRENKENILAEEYKGKDLLPLSETFNKEAFNSFFTNPVCAAIRIYYGMSEDLQTHGIIVGANDNNEDMLPVSSLLTLTDPVLAEGYRCPPTCPPPSPLNNP